MFKVYDKLKTKGVLLFNTVKFQMILVTILENNFSR